jgi:hypothetical protein
MGIKFNPLGFSGLDFVGGASSAPAARYTQSFQVSDFSLNSGEYQLTINALTHGRGPTPSVFAFEQNGSDFEQVNVSVLVNPLGDITISVSSNPDNRFDGVLLII